MGQTVIGIFNSAAEAQNAKDQLLSSGFTDSNVDIATGDVSDYNERSSDRDRDHEHESGIGRFFRNLFGGDENESERYTRVAERGCVVTVHAQSKDEAERAADLLDDYGAVDVDENYRKYSSSTGSDSDYNRSSWGTETAATAGAGTGLGTATPMGDTYIDTDQTTSGMVGDKNIDETRNYRDTDGGIFDDNSDRDRGVFDRERDRNYSDNEGRTIPIIEENLNIGKREVETGGVRLRSRIIEKPVEETLRLRQEHVRVERNPVDREATAADLDNFREETIEVREMSEEPVVAKSARVVEEVSLNKEVDHREENISDTVRNTTVDVEELERNRRRND